MGHRGKLEERARARELRTQAWTLQEIADELGVARSSVSVWVRDVEFEARPRPRVAAQRGVVHPLRQAKLDEIARLDQQGLDRVGTLTDREFLLAGVALYACEGSKTGSEVRFSNSDARLVAFFCAWFRRFFSPDEQRLRAVLYLHEGLDLEAAEAFWSDVTGIGRSQFGAAHRPAVRGGLRNTKHVFGCVTVRYADTSMHREVMGLARALAGVPGDADGALGDVRGHAW